MYWNRFRNFPEKVCQHKLFSIRFPHCYCSPVTYFNLFTFYGSKKSSSYLLFWFPFCCCLLTPSTTHPVSCPPLEVGWTGGLVAGEADGVADDPRLRTVSPLKRRLSSAAALFVKLTSAVITRDYTHETVQWFVVIAETLKSPGCHSTTTFHRYFLVTENSKRQ